MKEKTSFTVTPQFVLGLLIILIGLLFTLDNLYIIDAEDYLRYWPVVLIIYGVVKVLQPETQGSRFWGGVLIFVGAALLIDKLRLLDIRALDFWPLILVGLGAMMIYRARSRTQTSGGAPILGDRGVDKSSTINASAILGGSKRSVHTDDFRGGEATAIMGGVDIDFRNSKIAASPAILDVFAFWGGIEIKVPNSWTVTFEGTPILGGFDDKTFRHQNESGPQLIIRGTIVMGGVEVSN